MNLAEDNCFPLMKLLMSKIPVLATIKVSGDLFERSSMSAMIIESINKRGSTIFRGFVTRLLSSHRKTEDG